MEYSTDANGATETLLHYVNGVPEVDHEKCEYRSNWNWLMPVVGKLSNNSEEPEEMDGLRMCLLCNDIEEAFNEVASLISDLA